MLPVRQIAEHLISSNERIFYRFSTIADMYHLNAFGSDYFSSNTIHHITDETLWSGRTYEIVIAEEDGSVLPKPLLQLKAIIPANENEPNHIAPQNIFYFVTGEGIDEEFPSNSKFAINSKSGELFLVGELDRDLPYGKSIYNLTIFAEDEYGQILPGNATVIIRVSDVNDNAPFFDSNNYVVNITENQKAGIKVMKLTATDYDSPETNGNGLIRYSIEMNRVDKHGNLIFVIDESSGQLSTAVCCLDRETTSQYVIKVVATDGGGKKGSTFATINITDENDEEPKFVHRDWVGDLRYNRAGEVVLQLEVKDADLTESNYFVYKIANDSIAAKNFEVTTNPDGSGTLRLISPLRLSDTLGKSTLNLTIHVSDNGVFADRDHIDYCKVLVNLTGLYIVNDVNDDKMSDSQIKPLSELKRSDNRTSFIVDKNSSLNGKCPVNQCFNGGTCVYINQNQFYCVCQTSYGGLLCNELNDSDSNSSSLIDRVALIVCFVTIVVTLVTTISVVVCVAYRINSRKVRGKNQSIELASRITCNGNYNKQRTENNTSSGRNKGLLYGRNVKMDTCVLVNDKNECESVLMANNITGGGDFSDCDSSASPDGLPDIITRSTNDISNV